LLSIGFVKLFQAQKYEMLILAIVGWSGFIFICWPLGTRLINLGVLVSDYGNKFKYSYVKAFGPEFPAPQIQDYHFEEKEFLAYNRRFQLSEWGFAFSGGAVIATSYLWHKFGAELNIGWTFGIVLAISLGVTTRYLIKWIDLHFARKFPQHTEVEKFLKAKQAYEQVRKELRES
jgi:hypothetical protein